MNPLLEALWRALVQRTEERAYATAELIDSVLHGRGNVHRRETELRSGDRAVNGDRELLPRIARAAGLGVCIYLDNRRVAAASVVEAGRAPDLGGYADAHLVDVVLRRRESFRGTLQYHGRKHVVACRPLHATGRADDLPLGMIEVFHDEQNIAELFRSIARRTHGGEAFGTHEHANRIEGIMRFIDDVARRLQLLALNGNIIAAQAGEHGRAFRVVCRELSSLAEQSKEAVDDVRKLTRALGYEAEDTPASLRRAGARPTLDNEPPTEPEATA